MKIFPHYPARTVHDLDGDWDFAWLGDEVDLDTLNVRKIEFHDKQKVPSAFDAAGQYGCRRGTVALRRAVDITPDRESCLHFQGLGMWARILVDGHALQEWSAPYSGFQVMVPPAKFTRRELLVIVDNRFDAERVPLQMPFFDFYAYGGIYRSVTWHELPACRIDRVQIITTDVGTGRITARVRLDGKVPAILPLKIEIDSETVFDADTQPEGNEVRLELRTPNPTPWTPDTPNLHLLRAQIPEDAIVERFGLRIVGIDSGQITLNGKPIKLLGYCRHEAHPDHGPALPLEQLEQDLDILRDLGCNFIRGTHYSQDQRFLDLCDERGFLVKEESLGWGQGRKHFDNPALCDALELQTRLMVRNSFNHPCVIIWGYLNEGESDSPDTRHIYQRLADCIRAEDRSRLVGYATCRPFSDLNYDLCDVICVNKYPGWYYSEPELAEKTPSVADIWPLIERIRASIRERGFGDKPFLLTEIGAGAIPGWHDPYACMWSEEYQALYLETVCRGVVDSPDVAGVALWQFCDCRTYNSHRALNRPRSFNNKGTLDERRRPKMAYQTVRRIFGRRTGGVEGVD